VSKKIKYSSIKENEVIDISVAFAQAASLLDLAAKKAIDHNNESLMLEVADRWITIGSLFTGTEEKEHIDTNIKTKFGFCPSEEGDDENE
jgi:hypothetical protein